jgi:hypothetical protein
MVLVLAMTLLVAFTGMSTASAHTKYVKAPVIKWVSDARAWESHPDELLIKVAYKCYSKKGDNERDWLSVTLWQHGYEDAVVNGEAATATSVPEYEPWEHNDAVYKGKARAWCNGEKHVKWVELDRVRWSHKYGKLGYAHDGHAKVLVELKQVTDRKGKRDDVQKDREWEHVYVKGAGTHAPAPTATP